MKKMAQVLSFVITITVLHQAFNSIAAHALPKHLSAEACDDDDDDVDPTE
jgi:hypothetical protein